MRAMAAVVAGVSRGGFMIQYVQAVVLLIVKLRVPGFFIWEGVLPSQISA